MRYDSVRTRVQRAPDYDIDETARTMYRLEDKAATRAGRAEPGCAPVGTFHRGDRFDGDAGVVSRAAD